MLQGIIDSPRFAAFQLGYNVRLLQDAHATMLERDDPTEVDELVTRLERAAFVLLADDPPRYGAFKDQMHLTSEHYGDQLDLIYEGETLAFEPGGPEPIWLLTRDALERLELLGHRALNGDALLRAWYAVGVELAGLTLRLRTAATWPAGGEPTWVELSAAVGDLPPEDAVMVRDILDIRVESLADLLEFVEDAYAGIGDYAAVTEEDRPFPERELGDRQSATVEGDVAGVAGRVELPWTPRTPCQADILETLRGAGRRMTTTELLSAMGEADRVHGEGTVKLALADMMRSRVPTNCQGCRPRGYALKDLGHNCQ